VTDGGVGQLARFRYSLGGLILNDLNDDFASSKNTNAMSGNSGYDCVFSGRRSDFLAAAR
jgi:hypothetical protein